MILPVPSLQGTPINLAGERRQYVSYPAGCDGYSNPCYSRLESACEMRRRINQPDWTKPVCNLDGSYREYQCEAYSRSKCWCVYDNGMMIPGITKLLEQFSTECRKTKTKVITLANHDGHWAIHCPIKTQSNYAKRGKTCASKSRLVLVLLVIRFGFNYDWLRK